MSSQEISDSLPTGEMGSLAVKPAMRRLRETVTSAARVATPWPSLPALQVHESAPYVLAELTLGRKVSESSIGLIFESDLLSLSPSLSLSFSCEFVIGYGLYSCTLALDGLCVHAAEILSRTRILYLRQGPLPVRHVRPVRTAVWQVRRHHWPPLKPGMTLCD